MTRAERILCLLLAVFLVVAAIGYRDLIRICEDRGGVLVPTPAGAACVQPQP